jgi:hypothetical protein
MKNFDEMGKTAAPKMTRHHDSLIQEINDHFILETLPRV